MGSARTILHADMDAFYASIEQRDHPELRERPVLVGGTSDRGVVSAASYEARRFGVHSAMPTVEARRRCPHAVFLRGDMKRYSAESRRIFAIFRRFAPVVEGLSLDEAFLDLTGTERLLGPAAELGRRLRSAVRKETKLAVSVGIAPVKLVAKLASAAAKPDGLLEVPPEGVRDFLDPLPVDRLWGVGPVAAGRLKRAGFEVIRDLSRASPERLVEVLGEWGLELARLARGEDLREVERFRGAISYSEENTFASDVSDRARLESTVRAHAESVARRLRRDAVLARTVVLKLKHNVRRGSGPRAYPLLTRRVTLSVASDDGRTIATAANQLLARISLDPPVRLLGVGVTGIVPRDAGQLDLFAEGDPFRTKLNRALDEIAERFGSRAVVRAGETAPERAGLSLQIKRGEADDASG